MKAAASIVLTMILTACSAESKAPVQPAAPAAAEPAASTAAPDAAGTTSAAAAAPAEQTIDVAGGFTPASVNIPANTPVRLNFRRGSEATCADEIVFKDLNLRKKIAKNQTVSFDIPAQQARTLNFACGMDMMKGAVVVE